MTRPETDYVAAGLIAFAMGVVRGIVTPDGRGLLGFVLAVVVGICCGVVAAMIIGEFGGSRGWQYFGAAGLAIFGDRLVYAAFHSWSHNSMTVNISGGQNNVGDNDVKGDQNHER